MGHRVDDGLEGGVRLERCGPFEVTDLKQGLYQELGYEHPVVMPHGIGDYILPPGEGGPAPLLEKFGDIVSQFLAHAGGFKRPAIDVDVEPAAERLQSLRQRLTGHVFLLLLRYSGYSLNFIGMCDGFKIIDLWYHRPKL
jgi:hypothetical protein